MPDQPQAPNAPNAQTGRPGVSGRPSGEPSEEEREQFRQPTFWYNEKDRETSFRMEDERWSRSDQIKDWLKLLLMVIATFVWTLIVYFLEPGLR